MEIRKMAINELIPASYNPRKELKPGDAEYEKLRQSIERFGLVDPVIWNERTKTVVGGHQRISVMRNLGWDNIDVSVVDLSIEEEMALNVALNKISGEWDLVRLQKIIEELRLQEFDVDVTGYDQVEIEKLFGHNVVEDDFDITEVMENIKEPTTEQGDLYILGNHRLLCGDSTSAKAWDILMEGNIADMAFTDPPYNVNYGQTMKDKLRHKVSVKNAGRKILNDHFEDPEKFKQFLKSAIVVAKPYVKGDIYICMSSSELPRLHSAFLECGGHFSTYIIWVKNTFTIGRSNYQRQYEPILYGWFESTSHYWSGTRKLGDVYGVQQIIRDLDGVPMVRVEACHIESDIWEFNKPHKSEDHPTMKPLGLCARAIANSSRPGGGIGRIYGLW